VVCHPGVLVVQESDFIGEAEGTEVGAFGHPALLRNRRPLRRNAGLR
jgi:hypothetical protein